MNTDKNIKAQANQLGPRHGERKVPPAPFTIDQRTHLIDTTDNIESLVMAQGQRVQNTELSARATLKELQTQGIWAMVRDICVGILLLAILSFLIYRAYWVSSAVRECKAVGGQILLGGGPNG